MIVLNNLNINNLLSGKTAVALGSFDAIHKGHIKVIKSAIEYAKKNNLVSLVQLFDTSFFKEPINTLEKRIKIIEELGADFAVVESFDEAFRKMTYQEFVLDRIKDKYNAKAVFAGENYRFGHLAKGDSPLLASECQKYGIISEIIDCIEIDGIVSSTKIRNLIKAGEVETAAKYMLRPFSLEGKVIHGNEIGRRIGFPTANLSIPQSILLPKDGVYLTRVVLPEGIFFGITNIGGKPTVNETDRCIETYISDFCGDLYDKTIEIEFLKRIRDIKKFDSLDSLKFQLEEDKKYLN